MSNLERRPAELLLADPLETASLELLSPRDVLLGGPRAMSVRRTLPQRSRSLIGAWCFVDHYGPDRVADAGGMVVPPHPHTGLQTVSWLFAGEIEHRDSTGTHAIVRPGELNLMTAGRGIQHSELSTDAVGVLHGAQLWIALPDCARSMEPTFEHYRPLPTRVGDAVLRVFLGSLADQRSPVPTFTPLVGAQLDLPAGGRVELALDRDFEHGLLIDDGDLTVDGETAPADALAFLPVGTRRISLRARSDARALLIGGRPLGEPVIMWWNFIGRTHDEVVRFRRQWQEHVEDGVDDGPFGAIPQGLAPLPAPVMPNVRLRERGETR